MEEGKGLMSNHHHIPTVSSNKYVKIVFELEEADWHDYATESMWAAILKDNKYRLDNIPFYAYGVSYGDVVTAKLIDGELIFQNVVQQGGHSTYRIFLYASTTSNEFKSAWSTLEISGCTYERANDRLLGVDVPPQADIYQAYAGLERGEVSNVWDFEEANCEHPLRGKSMP